MPPRKPKIPENTPAAPPESRIRLTPEKVIQQALDIADREGLAALTMRRLAQDLGVEAMSLYHHFANKDRLLDAMVDRVFAEIDLPEHGPWKARLRARAVSVRETLLRHRWALGLMESRTSPGPATLHHHNAVVGCLRTSGFSVKAAAHAYALLDSYIYGFAVQEFNQPYTTFEEGSPAAEKIMQEVAAGHYPYLIEMATEHAMRSGYTFSQEFDIGLDLVMDGLERLQDGG